MLESLHRNFGLLIAFVLPGLVFLLGLLWLEDSDELRWVNEVGRLSQIGSVLLLLLASTAAGIVLSAVRWVVLDNLHHATGLTAPLLDYRNLQLKQESFMLVVENNYRYYLFYGNTLVGLLLLGGSVLSRDVQLTTLAIVRWAALCVVLYLASRDSLQRYYTRSRLIMGESPPARRLKAGRRC